MDPKHMGVMARSIIAKGQSKMLLQFKDKLDMAEDGPQLLQVSAPVALNTF